MKINSFLKILHYLPAVLLLMGTLGAQTINQKLITGIPHYNGTVDAYSMKYDAASGGWIYSAYDTVSAKFRVITPKGTSGEFNYISNYNALFDSEGNSYVVGSNNITDTSYNYSILKNNEVIGVYDNVADGWVMKDDILYFAAGEQNKSCLIAYDTKTGNMKKGKLYDEVRLAKTEETYTEGEPMGYVGFTSSGLPYYIAVLNDEVFLVIGDEEQKHYSDITWYDLKFSQNDVPVYIAKSQGKFYYIRGNTFTVKGNEEYKSFDWVYGPIKFDNQGTPLYTGQDSLGENKYRSTLMLGNAAITTVDGYIYNYMFTPSGKIAYIVSKETADKDGESGWEYYLVVDGKKDKVYSSVNNPVFNNGGVMYTASDKNNKYFVVRNDKVISEKFDYISDTKILPSGGVSYVASKYGNYDKHIPDKYYVYINDEEFGPYNIINTADWKTSEQVMINGNNYAFMAGELTDPVNYTYRYTIVSNSGKSKEFDNVGDLKYVNGKLVYFAGNMKGKGTYLYDYGLYVNNKKLGETYSAYSDVNVNNEGTITFTASNNNEIYYVTAKP
ncbi:MAG: hypothetical protein IT280_03480 [Ignavibacteria bacterium]|nr:hypothetical protein [Ignavibacteria bacterium]